MLSALADVFAELSNALLVIVFRAGVLVDDFGLAPAVVLDLLIQPPEFSVSLNDALSTTIGSSTPANVHQERRRSGG